MRGGASRTMLKTDKHSVVITGRTGKRSAALTDSKGSVLLKDFPEANWQRMAADIRRLIDAMRMGIHGITGSGLRR